MIITLFSSFFTEKYTIIASLTIFSAVVFLCKKKVKLMTVVKAIIFFTIFSLVSTILSSYMLHEQNWIRTFTIIEGRFLISFFIVSWFFMSVSPYEISIMLEKMYFPITLVWMITITYQFIPIFVSEARTVNKIRKIRGISIKGKNPIKIGKSLRYILNPLIVSSINRGIELAESMILRGFKPKRREVRIYEITFKLKDLIVIIILTVTISLTMIFSPF